MDIALAKGLVGDRVFTRDEIIQIGIERSVARNLEEGNVAPDLDKISKEVSDHVNRIFRGGTGETKRLASGKQVQAVYSKDSVYYGGYFQALSYVNQQVKLGVSMSDIVDFLLHGKFDATNPEHVSYVKDKLSN
jgi:hypothetical protein